MFFYIIMKTTTLTLKFVYWSFWIVDIFSMLRLRDKNPSLNCFQAEIRIQKLWKIRFGSEFRRQNNQYMWRIRFATHCKGCNMQVLCIPVMWFNDWNKWNYAPSAPALHIHNPTRTFVLPSLSTWSRKSNAIEFIVAATESWIQL